MEVEFIHANDLAVAASSGATLDAKRGALAGLPNIGKCKTADMSAKSLGEAHSSGGFALTKGRWGNAGNDNIPTITAVCQALDDAQIHFCLVGTIWLQFRWGDTNLL